MNRIINEKLIAAAIARPLQWTFTDTDEAAIFAPAKYNAQHDRVYIVTPENDQNATIKFECFHVAPMNRVRVQFLAIRHNFETTYHAREAASHHYQAYCDRFEYLGLLKPTPETGEEALNEMARREAAAASARATRALYEEMNHAARAERHYRRDLKQLKGALFSDNYAEQVLAAAIAHHAHTVAISQRELADKTARMIKHVLGYNTGDSLPPVKGTVREVIALKHIFMDKQDLRRTYRFHRSFNPNVNPFI